MKYLRILVCAGMAIVLLGSCKKENPKISSNPTSFIGSWELIQIEGGVGTIHYAAGNGAILTVFNGTYSTTDSTYSFFAQGRHQKKGIYKIVADTSVIESVGLVVAPNQFTNRIILDNDTISSKVFYQITNDTLTILSGYFPLDSGVKMVYKKQ